MFKEIINAVEEEFTEDNESTLVSFLDECYRSAKAGAFPQVADMNKAPQVADAPAAEPLKLLNRFEILKEK